MKTGLVFDIQRFALHDGPGIRTVIFLKGCPLQCQWCSNPEAMALKPQLGFDAAKCVHCMECVPVCNQKVFTDKYHRLAIEFDKCNACGVCVDNCKEDALVIYGEKYSVSRIMEIIKKDLPYYQNSGGGITLSGGEPLQQTDFSVEILREAKKLGLHTCIETSGYGLQSKINEFIPYTDLFLFDYKITDSRQHEQYTGKKNELIISNLKFIAEQNVSIILRCIIIQGINDHIRHFKAIAALERELDSIQKVEIMPYHNYGEAKYYRIGKQCCVQKESVQPDQVKQWIQNIKQAGGKQIY